MLLLALSIIFLTCVLIAIKRHLNYWDKRGVVNVKTLPIIGNLKDVILRKKNIAYTVQDWYEKHPDKRYYGTFLSTVPCLVVRDLDLIKNITIKDFDHFVDHISLTDNEQEPIFGRNLLSLKGLRWRAMRHTLSPSFTGNKIRIMFGLISDCISKLNDYYLKKLENADIVEVEIKDLTSRISIDIIATTAFGLECNSIGEDSIFYKMGMEIMKPNIFAFFKGLFQVFFPRIAKKFKVSQISQKEAKFFEKVIKETLKHRLEYEITRPDMIHILMEAQRENPSGRTRLITVNDIVAQGFIFFMAGFEPVSTLSSHVCHEVAMHRRVQEKLIREIDETLREVGGISNLDYETLSKMKYLDAVISETLRKWPPAVFMNRECVKDYTIEGSEKHGEKDFVVEKGMGIVIPVFAIHRDPEIYPNPNKFDPERFNDENRKLINPYAYLPFGLGPRNCIGLRLALLETKLLITHLLSKFLIVPTEKTKIPIILSKKKPSLVPDNFYLGLIKRPKSKLFAPTPSQ